MTHSISFVLRQFLLHTLLSFLVQNQKFNELGKQHKFKQKIEKKSSED